MSVDNNNDYKASVSLALHGADIATNQNTLHISQGTSNSCGTNCAVDSVVEENDETHEIWQEVYPHDRHVVLGESDAGSLLPLDQADITAGHGNYVFVIWRHYRGCIQGTGNFRWASHYVPPTTKR